MDTLQTTIKVDPTGITIFSYDPAYPHFLMAIRDQLKYRGRDTDAGILDNVIKTYYKE